MSAQEFIQTSRGRVYVTRIGAGEPIVLLPGNGQSWREFEPIGESLGADHQLVIWDMPGQGDSDPTEPGYGIDDYADQLVEVMDSLGIDRAAVAGSSVGAFIAVSLAARHPDRVTATGLIELQFRERAFWEGEEMWDLVQRMFSIPTQTREAVAPRFEAEIDDAFVLNWNIDRNKAGTAELLRAMWAIRTYDLKQVVAKLSPPVVAIFGDSGPTVGSLENAKAWLPEQARTVVVEGSGHFLAHDRPDALESELRALLQAATSTASA